MLPSRYLKRREDQIKRIQLEYGYDRDNAERVMDYQQLKGQQVFFNTVVGGYCAYKFQPMHAEAAAAYPLFRKRWMRYPI